MHKTLCSVMLATVALTPDVSFGIFWQNLCHQLTPSLSVVVMVMRGELHLPHLAAVFDACEQDTIHPHLLLEFHFF